MAENSNTELKKEPELNNLESLTNISTKPLTQTPKAKISHTTPPPKDNTQDTTRKANLPKSTKLVENSTDQTRNFDNGKVLSDAAKFPKTNTATPKTNSNPAKTKSEDITHNSTINANLQDMPTASPRSQKSAKIDDKKTSKTGITFNIDSIRKILKSKILNSYTANSQKAAKFVKATWCLLSPLTRPIATTCLFVAVTIILIRANSIGWPLSRLTPAMGTLLLSVLSKLTDYGLEWSTDTMWEMVNWGPFLKEGEDLLTFLALTSNVDGWVRLIFLGLLDSFPCKNSDKDPEKGKCFHSRKNRGASENHQVEVQEPPADNLQTRQDKSSRKVSKYLRTFKLWSLARLLIWAVIQLPAVIMMAIVNQEIKFIPANWTEISGGLGVFDTSTVTEVIAEPSLWADIFFLIRDATMSYQVDPVNTYCRTSDSCASFLFPGGLKAVAPWPYSASSDKSLTAYITKNAPAYQMDVWDAPTDTKWDSDVCTIFGTDNQTAFQLCISYSDGQTDQLLAGWRICPSTVLASGECSQAGSWSASPNWATYLAFNRRLATTAFDRFTSQILTVQSLLLPMAQDISPSNFSAAINAMICPLTNATEISTYCIGDGALAQLTSAIFTDILLGAAAPTSSVPLDDLRNLFATALIFFNPVTSGLESGPKPYSIQPGLQPENYFMGSPARRIMFVAPELWTAKVYAAVMGALIFLGWVVIIWAKKEHPRECGHFPWVNYLKLSWGNNGDGDFDIKKRFEEGREEKEMELLAESSDITLKFKDGDDGEMEVKRSSS